MKVAFIINPVSGTGKQKNIEAIIRVAASKFGAAVSIVFTQHAGHAALLAKEAIEARVDRIAIVGGDGSVNELARALINTSVPMAIVPTGSGNGLSRHLKIPMNIQKAIERVFSGSEKRIDVGFLNEHLFLSTAGFGFDAHVAHLFANQKKRGFKTYIKTVRKELFAYKPFEFELKAGGVEIKQKAFMLSAANIPQFGNNFTINPLANESDGLLNFTLIKPFPKYKIPAMVNRFFRNTAHKSKYFEQFVGERFELELPHEYAHVDGEPVLLVTTRAVVQIQKKCLVVIC